MNGNELTDTERETLGQALADNRVGARMLRQIDEAVSAYAAGAANAGDPDAVVSEVALILAGEIPAHEVHRQWLLDHATSESPARGLEQSAAGDVVDLGDFTQYVDDE